MTTFVFANNVNTTLSAAITTTDTSITLSSSANLPTLASGQVMPLTISNNPGLTAYEIVYVTAISGATLTVERAQEGTTAQAWSTGSYAYATQTAQSTQPALGFTPASLAQIIEAANVVGYGADPTGVKDSSVAFQNAFNSGFAPSIPPGTYKIGTLLTANSGLRIYGAGSQVCIINASTNGFLSATLGTAQGIEIEGLTINQATASTTGGTGVSVTATVANAGQPIFRDVVFGSNQNNSTSTTGAFSVNCALVSTNGAYFSGCQFTGPATPSDATQHVTVNGTSSLTAFQTLFDTCTFTLGTTAIQVGNGSTSYVQGVSAIGCQFISVHDYIGYWDNSTSGFLADSFRFIGCQMSANTTIIYANNVMQVGIIGCYVLPAEADTGANPILINLVGCSGVVSGNDFYAGNTPTAIGVSISGTGNGGGVTVSGNEFFDFNGTGAMPIQVTGTGNTIGLNGYVNCNANSIAAGNIVADVNPATGAMTLPAPILINSSPIGSSPIMTALQRANGADMVTLEAATTVSPTGYFLRFVNSGNTANVFGVDINGNLYCTKGQMNSLTLLSPASTSDQAASLGQLLSTFARNGSATYSVSTTLTSANAGQIIFFAGTSSATFTLPLSNAADPYTMPIIISNQGRAPLTVAVQSGDVTDLIPNILYPEQTCAVNNDGSADWHTIFNGAGSRSPYTVGVAIANNEAVQLAQVSTVTPQVIKYGGGGTAASTTYGTTATFTCPTAGFINIDATWQNGAMVALQPVTGHLTTEILVNGTVIESDGGGGGNSWSMYGTAAVSAGSNTVTVQYVVGTTALAQAIFIRALATFLPKP